MDEQLTTTPGSVDEVQAELEKRTLQARLLIGDAHRNMCQRDQLVDAMRKTIAELNKAAWFTKDAEAFEGLLRHVNRLAGLLDTLDAAADRRGKFQYTRDQFDHVDGCSTGDCPHGNVNDCVKAQAATIADQAYELEYKRWQIRELGAMLREAERATALDGSPLPSAHVPNTSRAAVALTTEEESTDA